MQSHFFLKRNRIFISWNTDFLIVANKIYFLGISDPRSSTVINIVREQKVIFNQIIQIKSIHSTTITIMQDFLFMCEQ